MGERWIQNRHGRRLMTEEEAAKDFTPLTPEQEAFLAKQQRMNDLRFEVFELTERLAALETESELAAKRDSLASQLEAAKLNNTSR